MKKIKDILNNVAIEKIYGKENISINKIEFDSRKISSNDLFVAQKGLITDGHQFIDKAIQQGAIAIIFEDINFDVTKYNSITFIKVKDSNLALAKIASNYYKNPSKKINLIGITGTNGKTTIATLLFNLFKEAGYKVGLLSTVAIKINNSDFRTTHTTPDSLTINDYLHKMVEQNVTHCFMEVSSHGIYQQRTAGLHFCGSVFTNLTHDHLDYHKTFAEYRDVKKKFFDELPKTAFAIVNIDDKNGAIMLQNTKAQKLTYALKTLANYKTKIIENQISGLLLQINNTEVWTRLIGNFNAYNITAVYAVAIELGLEKNETLRLISKLQSVNGRFQYNIINGITAIVDYAHTPDALKNVLETIIDIKNKNTNIITVIGCGGDRDKTKRPKIGFIATQLSDQVIFTSDNPRTENPDVIINEIEKGVPTKNKNKYLSITNRKQAIRTASKLAKKGDILLIAGKGHETYQEINNVKTEFDDYKTIVKILKTENNLKIK